jgi:glycosyltransferase involved in cell wall biosynthesis
MAQALRQRGHVVARRLDELDGPPDLFHFVGAFYGLGGAFDAARGLPRLVMPILLHSDASLAAWRPAVDRARSWLPGSLLNARHRMLREAELVVTNSEFEAGEARQWGAERVAVVPAGVDLSRFLPEPVPTVTLPDPWQAVAREFERGGAFVVSVGRFERRKNQLEVAEACRSLGLRLLCIGRRSPTESGWLDELRRRAGTALVAWEDAPFEVVRWALTRAAVHVLATRHETAGLVSLEAAACGARPVAVDQPTAREYLAEMGEFAASSAPEHLARAITSARRRGQTSAAERHDLGRFDWHSIAASLETAYLAAMANAHGANQS